MCGDALYGLTAGLDGSTAEELDQERRQHLKKLLVGNVTKARPAGGATPGETLQQAAAHQPMQEPEPQLGVAEKQQQRQEAEASVEDLPM